jgi:hypothetical protein
MTKTQYAETMATLLCLDRVMIKDLMKLDIDTLAKMYVNYIQNCKDANNALEDVQSAYKSLLTSSGSSNTSASRHRVGKSNKKGLGNQYRQ